jgi:hypothetical protein
MVDTPALNVPYEDVIQIGNIAEKEVELGL